MRKINWNNLERWLIWIMLGVLLGLILGGCNTVKGMAKDMYSVTEGIQEQMGNDNQPSDIAHNDWN